MKNIRILCLLLSLLTALQLTVPAVFAAEADSSVSSGCHSVDAVKPLMNGDKLLETAKAVFLYERNSDTLVYAYHADDVIDPAGMPKLMTALLALEKGNLSDTVTVTKTALDQVAIGSVSAGLARGEELTLEDLLYLLILKSANDAAPVIAEHIAGSHQDFVDMMNRRAQELGCTNTVFTNAHGLPDEKSGTTARDLCRILDAALDHEEFRKLFTAVSYTVPATNKSEERKIQTSNLMALEGNKSYYDSRVTGGKTGATKDGRCLALTAEGSGMELISIVMGAVPTYEVENIVIKTYGSFEETKVLLDHCLSQFEYRQIFYPNQAVTQYPVTDGANDVVVSPDREMSAVLPVNLDRQQLSWRYGTVAGDLKAPIDAGQVLSSLQVWYGDTCVAQTELVAMYDVPVWEEPADSHMATNPEEPGGAEALKVVGIIFGVLVGTVVIWVAVNAIRRAMVRSRRKRRRKEQRRRGNA